MPPIAQRRRRALLWGCLALYALVVAAAGLVLLLIAVGPLSLTWVPVPVLAVMLAVGGIRRCWRDLH